MLESSRVNRFRAPQIDSETVNKNWIFVSESTGFDSDLPEPGEPCLSILSTSNRKNEKNLRFFSLFRFDVLKIDRGMGFPGEPGRTGAPPLPEGAHAGFTTERKGGRLPGAPRGLQTAGSVAQGVGRLLPNFGKIATGFRVFGFEILGV